MIGTSSMPSSFAAMTRPWPSTISSWPSGRVHTPIGSLKPKASMLFAISPTCFLLCSFAFLAYGTRSSVRAFSTFSFGCISVLFISEG